ncbi:MAG: hypothetical protein GF401_16495 [Chitinivibrionales bacterium]|nr:hypothetical protein [Chitinivibrionales bacterium]
MAQLNNLKRQIAGTEQMGSVVGTMKALAAVNIHHYEKAAEAVDRYYDTILRALQGVFKYYRHLLPGARTLREEKSAFIICGAEQSMAGPFDEQLLHYIEKRMEETALTKQRLECFVFGERMTGLLGTSGFSIRKSGEYPGSLLNISDSVYNVLGTIDAWREQSIISRVEIYFNRPVSGGSHTSDHATLFPVDRSLVRELQNRPWGSSAVPQLSGPWEDIYGGLLRNMIFTGVIRALINTLAAENAARLAAMQAAEKYISERLGELNMVYNRERQSSITAELLDIVAGVEALKQ